MFNLLLTLVCFRLVFFLLCNHLHGVLWLISYRMRVRWPQRADTASISQNASGHSTAESQVWADQSLRV